MYKNKWRVINAEMTEFMSSKIMLPTGFSRTSENS